MFFLAEFIDIGEYQILEVWFLLYDAGEEKSELVSRG